MGQVFNYSLKIQSDKAYDKAIFPDTVALGTGGDVEFIGKKHFKISNRADSVNYTLQFFGTKDVLLPPLPVNIVTGADTTNLLSESVHLNFKSVNEIQTEELAPLKPNFQFKNRFWLWLVEALITLLIAYLIYIKYFKKRTIAQSAELPPQPVYSDPLHALEMRLTQLKDSHDSHPEKDFKYFYSELGDALRTYMEQVYEIHALEMTTREIARHLDAFDVDVDLSSAIKSILREADLVKFANLRPSIDDSWLAFDKGVNFYEYAKVHDVKRISRRKEEFEASFKLQSEDKAVQEEEDFDELG